jgi:hypothetical protein
MRETMNRILLLLLFLGSWLANCFDVNGTASAETGDMIRFYRTADSVASYPDLPRPLSIVCQHKVGRYFVTFAAYDTTRRVLLAAVTTNPIVDPNMEISRVVDFNGITPIQGKTSTWGYVFDRNGDGRIDYMALVGGAAAFELNNFPNDFPRHGQRMNKKQLEFFLGRCALVFNHWADDNFDGTIDGIVHVDVDSTRDWVKRRLVIRSTKFDGKFQDVWAFRAKITEKREKVAHTLTSVPYNPVGTPRSEINAGTVKEMTEVLRIINSAAAECNLQPGDFYER